MNEAAIFAAKQALALALFQLLEYEDNNEDVEFACENIRSVLDQLCRVGPERIRFK